MFVMVKIGFDSIVGHEQVWPAVIVIVCSSHRKVFALGLKYVHGASYIGECPVAIVVIQRVNASLVSTRRTAALHGSYVAISGAVRIQRYVASDIKIQVAIAIVIEKCRAAVKGS